VTAGWVSLPNGHKLIIFRARTAATSSFLFEGSAVALSPLDEQGDGIDGNVEQDSHQVASGQRVEAVSIGD
jgi:hypothetical protein